VLLPKRAKPMQIETGEGADLDRDLRGGHG
jgi:hypothetical protein